jgi:flagellar basal-body rod protein FlgC
MNVSLLPALPATADALQANRLSMDVIAQNIANAQTTRDIDGQGPYQRRQVVFESYLQPEMAAQGQLAQSVRVAQVQADTRPGEMLYLPEHPHANPDGMVEMPNVQVAMEMVDLISTSRAYEANLNVLKTSRQMAQQALAIGR